MRVGYLRDLRRLTVAMSRARLGLYVLGRRDVFEACHELRPAFDCLFERPDKLKLVVGETFPTARAVSEESVEEAEMDGVEHLGQYVFEMTQAKVTALRAGAEALPSGDGGPAGGVVDDEDVHAGGELEEVDEGVEDEGEMP